MNWLAAFALGVILHPSVAVRDTDGVMREPLKVEKGHLEALFFVTYDCPVSNYYSHEIRRICDGYAQRGVGCSLVYTDATMTDDQAKKHAQDYGHGAYPKIVDRDHRTGEGNRRGDHAHSGRGPAGWFNRLSRAHRQLVCRHRHSAPRGHGARCARCAR